jgi:hypothetical protein
MSLRARLLARPTSWLRVRIVNIAQTAAQSTVESNVAGLPERIDSVAAELHTDLHQQIDVLTGALAEHRLGTQNEIRALRNEVLALTRRLNRLEDSEGAGTDPAPSE